MCAIAEQHPAFSPGQRDRGVYHMHEFAANMMFLKDARKTEFSPSLDKQTKCKDMQVICQIWTVQVCDSDHL